MMIWLVVILLLILFLPLFFKPVEEQIEIFLFAAGAAAVSVTGHWSAGLLHEIFSEPLMITVAVLIAGVIFMIFSDNIAVGAKALLKKTGPKLFVFLLVAGLGIVSSVITAIIAALVLAETIRHLKMPRKTEVKLVILTCFSIGMGAALTPIGEPLSTITISKLQGPPHNADFWFLLRHIWWFVAPGIAALGFIATRLVEKNSTVAFDRREDPPSEKENIKSVLVRTGKVYVFIMGLVMLGEGFKPLIDGFITKVPYYFLYWINIVSAVLDNATLAAAEITPGMSLLQIKSAVLGLIISGGMLIPGNIPNIIAANSLKIKSREWALFALPVGLVFMAAYFLAIILLNYLKV